MRHRGLLCTCRTDPLRDPRRSRDCARFRRVRGGADGDGPTALLAFAVAGLPADRQVWGRAMRAELDQVVGAVKRWQFSVGCTWAAAAIRARTTLGSRRNAAAKSPTVAVFAVLPDRRSALLLTACSSTPAFAPGLPVLVHGYRLPRCPVHLRHGHDLAFARQLA